MSRRLLPVLALLIAVAMVIAAGCGGSQSSPENTVKAFMSAWQKQDYKTMANLCGLTPELFMYDGMYYDDDVIKSYTVGKKEAVGPNETRVWVNVVFDDDYYGEMSWDFIFMTVKRGSKWFIDIYRMDVDFDWDWDDDDDDNGN